MSICILQIVNACLSLSSRKWVLSTYYAASIPNNFSVSIQINLV
uniref:Uncharacterized protein n=1 Tax=Anguilla anguilla TaxID=7936 RepID=A0A0E9WYV2_ANGAN